VLLILLAAGAAGEACMRGATPGRPVAIRLVLGAAMLVLLAASVPTRLSEVAARRGDLAAQATPRADLRALADRGALPAGCDRVAASNHKLIPLLALWTGRAPANFTTVGAAEAYVEPANATARRTLLFASSDPPEPTPPSPTGAVEVARNGAWRVEARC
jgi:hypothetical protein